MCGILNKISWHLGCRTTHAENGDGEDDLEQAAPWREADVDPKDKDAEATGGEEARGHAGSHTASSSSKQWRTHTGQVGHNKCRTGIRWRKRGKDGELTGSSCVCSEGMGEDQSGQISPTNREEEVDVFIAIVDPGSIP
jgi:hypothetical protein